MLRLGKNSGLILRCLRTKVHEILGHYRGPLVLTNAFAGLFTSCFFRRHLPLSLKVVEKPNKCKIFGPNFLGRDDPDLSTADC